MKRKIVTGVSLAAVIALSGCGGGSSSSESAVTTLTGQFIDSPVAGLNYSCTMGGEGVTDSNGAFTCNVGDTITFALGNLILGSAAVASVISPRTLYPDNDEMAINVAQILQTLDSDNNASNGIVIDETMLDALQDANTTLDAADFESVAASYIGTVLVGEAEAEEHLNNTLFDLYEPSVPVGDAGSTNVVIFQEYNEDFCSNLETALINLDIDGFGSYETFTAQGGELSVVYSSGVQSTCTEYADADTCQIVNQQLAEEGSCVMTVVIPEAATTETIVDDGGGQTAPSGTILWSHTVESGTVDLMNVDAAGMVHFQNLGDHQLIALESTGSEAWVLPYSANYASFANDSQNNLLYVNDDTNGQMAKVVSDGTKTVVGISGAPASNTKIVTDESDNIYYTASGTLYSVTADGNQRWSLTPENYTTESFVWSNVLIGKLNDNSLLLTQNGKAVFIVNENGVVTSHYMLPEEMGYYAIDKSGNFYYTSTDNTLRVRGVDGALNAEVVLPFAISDTMPQIVFGAPMFLVTENGQMIHGSDDKIVVMNISDGSVAWTQSLSSDPDIFALSPDEQTLYIAQKNKLHAFSMQTGTELWTVDLRFGTNLLGLPIRMVVAPSGVIYVSLNIDVSSVTADMIVAINP